MRAHKGRDYDEALVGSIPLTFKGKLFDFPAEAPLEVAMEWMDRQTVEYGSRGEIVKQAFELLGETQTEYTRGNFAVLFGEHWEAMKAEKVGYSSLNAAYADLLDWWGLWNRPAETDLDVTLARIETLVGLAVEDKDRRATIGSLLDQVKSRVAELEAEAEHDEDVKEDAANPA